MNIQEIQDLIKFVSKTQVSEVEIEQKDFKIIIKSSPKNKGGLGDAQQPIIVQAQAPAAAPVAAAPVAAAAPAAPAPAAPAVDDNLITIKSPMIGTFYRSPGADKPMLAEVGVILFQLVLQFVSIEAMKLFNEIESEISGKIVKILVDDASPVEYDQPLFLVEP